MGKPDRRMRSWYISGNALTLVLRINHFDHELNIIKLLYYIPISTHIQLFIYIQIMYTPSRSSIDLSCADELSKSKTPALPRLIVYIYTYLYI